MSSRTRLITFCVPVAVMATAIVYADFLFESVDTPVSFTADIGDRKQLFLDEMIIAEIYGASKFQYHPRKHPGNPIIKADKPWEQGADPVRAATAFHGQGVIYDKEERIFKLWYRGAYFDNGTHALCYAVSTDGYHWEKPELGLVEFQGSRKNNVLGFYKNVTWTNFIKTPHDPDPSRRYKAQGEVEPMDKSTAFHGVGVAFSPDGLRWTPYHGNPVLKKGPSYADGGMILGWDPRIKKYVQYNRMGKPLVPQWPGYDSIRSIGYSESDDFIHWTPSNKLHNSGVENPNIPWGASKKNRM